MAFKHRITQPAHGPNPARRERPGAKGFTRNPSDNFPFPCHARPRDQPLTLDRAKTRVRDSDAMAILNSAKKRPRPDKRTLRPGLYNLTTCLPPWPVLSTRPRNSCRQKAIEWASLTTRRSHSLAGRGQIRSFGRYDVGWKCYPAWEAGLYDGGRLASVASWGTYLLFLEPSRDG